MPSMPMSKRHGIVPLLEHLESSWYCILRAPSDWRPCSAAGCSPAV